VSGEESEQTGCAGTLARVTDLRDGGTAVVLDRDVSRHRDEHHPRVRRWDQHDGASVQVASNWTELEDGIAVCSSGGEFRSGDYWTFPARTATG
jgi:hypothetical protein